MPPIRTNSKPEKGFIAGMNKVVCPGWLERSPGGTLDYKKEFMHIKLQYWEDHVNSKWYKPADEDREPLSEVENGVKGTKASKSKGSARKDSKAKSLAKLKTALEEAQKAHKELESQENVVFEGRIQKTGEAMPTDVPQYWQRNVPRYWVMVPIPPGEREEEFSEYRWKKNEKPEHGIGLKLQIALEEIVTQAAAEMCFITVGRPYWDWTAEYESGALYNPSKKEQEDLNKLLQAQQEIFDGLPAEDYPEWQWSLSKRASQMLHVFEYEMGNRDPEQFDVYFGNDYLGYGVQEVLDGHMQSFWMEFKKGLNKGESNPLILWSHMEALAWLLSGDNEYVHAWYMCDDSEKNQDQLELIGQAFISTLNQLERYEVWDLVPNISLIHALFVKVASDFRDLMRNWDGDEHVWGRVTLAYAAKHDLDLGCIQNIEPRIAEVGAVSELPKRLQTQVKGKAGRDKFKFKKTWDEYCDGFGIGGNTYDISKMSEEARKRRAIGGRMIFDDDED